MKHNGVHPHDKQHLHETEAHFLDRKARRRFERQRGQKAIILAGLFCLALGIVFTLLYCTLNKPLIYP